VFSPVRVAQGKSGGQSLSFLQVEKDSINTARRKMGLMI
jgi:hypothetical protein